MGKPTSITITGNGSTSQNSDPIPLSLYQNPFEVGLMLNTDGSTTTGTVQYTLSEDASGPWFATSISGATADEAGVLTTPATHVRLVVGASGTDTLTLTVIQPMSR